MSHYKRKRFVLATRLVEASMDNNQMIQDVYQIFSNLQTKNPIIQPNLEKCFKEIQARFVKEQVSSKEDKKGKLSEEAFKVAYGYETFGDVIPRSDRRNGK